MSQEHERAIGGKLITPGMLVLGAIIGTGGLVVLYRMLFGLGAVSNMNDGYPWGIWKPLNVVTFTGIGAGAYAMGLVTYIYNRGQYHPLIRSAIIAGAMAYTLAGTSVLIDLGRYWNLWVVFWPPIYNLNSVLLEVSICVMTYMAVLWVEITPAVLERLEKEHTGILQKVASFMLPYMRMMLPFIIALALLLPTMHQSSLGGLYMVTVTKLHKLWHTSWISGLFLISCLTMGFGSIVIIENITDMVYKRRMNQKMLASIRTYPIILLVAFLAIRLGDLVYRGRLGLMFKFDFYSVVFLAEMALYVIPLVMLLNKKWAEDRSKLFLASLLLVAGGAMYRFDTYLVAYLPQNKWVYSPSIGEILFSATLASTGILVYVVMVKLFPIMSNVLERKKVQLY
jgi:Ni/Fe-hydrogenase subunit HybB-like protein